LTKIPNASLAGDSWTCNRQTTALTSVPSIWTSARNTKYLLHSTSTRPAAIGLYPPRFHTTAAASMASPVTGHCRSIGYAVDNIQPDVVSNSFEPSQKYNAQIIRGDGIVVFWTNCASQEGDLVHLSSAEQSIALCSTPCMHAYITSHP